MDILKSILDRIFKNPTSTIASLAPMIAAIIAGWGFSIDTATLTTILTAVYSLILLFMKDAKPTVITSTPVNKSGPTATAPITSAPVVGTPAASTLNQSVDGILGRP
jgi:hypothetical protein